MLKKKKIEIKEIAEARSSKIESPQAWKILKEASTIVVGKGKKIVKFEPKIDKKSDILEICLGRSGTLRAPTLHIGTKIIVGYNDEIFEKIK